ncbi:MAG: phosphodiester glycosidase family protein [Fimbriimonadaceae bacterium]|nr:phosphodiester glycosidase family protein [Fimbriimonadaceae bacterium]QYK56067.1 MAG: phosphodiester glycosidase family protein [Fimbriimonadaceae bacterium]
MPRNANAFVLALLSLAGCSSAQRWEKPIAPGVVYRMEYTANVPRMIHAVRFSLAATNVTSRAELTGERVFLPGSDDKGREPLSKTMAETQALVGINGDFFPWTGDPLGAMVRDGEMVSRPFRGRSVFAWGPNFATVTRLKWSATVVPAEGDPIPVDGLNEEVGDNAVSLTTGTGGFVLAEKPSKTVYLQGEGVLTPDTTWSGTVVTTVDDAKEAPVGRDQVAVTARGNKVPLLEKLARGDKVTVRVRTEGADWEKVKNVVSGGPAIVSGGKPLQAWSSEDFQDDFATKRHPRTAVGVTEGGDVWLVVVEGRQAMSEGATLVELADIMVRFGCKEAVNLDGGGSSQIALSGLTLNRPSDGAERPIADCLLLFAKPSPQYAGDMVIAGSAKVAEGGAAEYRVVDSAGRAVPNSNVVWAAQGQGWIDQGGRLRGLKPGRAEVQAWVGGRVFSLTVTVESK